MTSPAQLKYLDAIGIPVWVSRDRVLQLDALQPQDNSKQKPATDSDCIGSVDDILHNLDTEKVLAVAPNLENELPPSGIKILEKSFPKIDKTTKTLNPSNTHINEIGRTDQHILYGYGDLNADWLIIGESPATSEELQHQPFTTNSSVLLNNMLKSVGLNSPREDAYLINVLKQACSSDDLRRSNLILNKLLHEKIASIKPKVILVVGQVAAQNLLQSSEPLVRLRLKKHTLPNTTIPVVVTYYPSYLLSKPADKRKTWEDLKLALLCYETN